MRRHTGKGGQGRAQVGGIQVKIVDLSGICFECDVSLQKIESICIETEINRHGICRIKGVVDRKYYEENPEFMAHACSFRIVYRSEQNQEVLFSGFIQEGSVIQRQVCIWRQSPASPTVKSWILRGKAPPIRMSP